MKPSSKKPPHDKEKKQDNVVLITNSAGNGLWCRVKAPTDTQTSLKSKPDISDVEKKAEKSIIDLLQSKIAHITNELESLSLDKQQIEFESSLAIKERDILKQQYSNLLEQLKSITEKYVARNTKTTNIEQENRDFYEKYAQLQKDNIESHNENSHIKIQFVELQKQKDAEAKSNIDIINKLQEQLEDLSEQNEKLENELKSAPKRYEKPISEIEEKPLKKEVAMKENNEQSTKTIELVNEALSLRKKLKSESETRKQIQEHIKLKDTAIKQLTEQNKALSEQLSTLKTSLSYIQSQLSQKTSDCKLIEGKLKTISQKLSEIEKSKVTKPEQLKLADSIELTEVEAQPYLFGPGDS